MRPSGSSVRVLRLGDVVQQRAEAQPAAAGELVGQRLGEQRADGRGQRLVAERGRGIALEVDARLQDLERVAVHVAVVVGVLLDAAQRRELGQDGGHEVELVHEREPAHRRVGADDAPQLGEDALLRGAGQPGRVRADRGRRVGVDLEAELGRQARDAQRAQRIGDERLGADHAQALAVEVARAAVGVDELAAGQRLGHRVDRQVARAEVGLERAALQRGDVDLPAAVAGDHAPGAELVGELERGAAGAAAEAARGAAHVAVDDDVEVGRRAPQQAVAQRAADEPCALARPAPRAASRSQRHPVAVVLARHARGQRARDLVVDGAQPPRHLLGRAGPRR